MSRVSWYSLCIATIIILSNSEIRVPQKTEIQITFLHLYPLLYFLNVGLLFGGKCATFGTCLALICTKNRLKSLEVTVVETSKIRDLQPFSHFTKNY